MDLPPGFSVANPQTCDQESVFYFAGPKAKSRREDRATQRDKITRSAPHIPFNLMGVLVCPVLTRNEFRPQCSIQSLTIGWLTAWWLEQINVHLQKCKGVGFEVETLVTKKEFPSRKMVILCNSICSLFWTYCWACYLFLIPFSKSYITSAIVSPIFFYNNLTTLDIKEQGDKTIPSFYRVPRKA